MEFCCSYDIRVRVSCKTNNLSKKEQQSSFLNSLKAGQHITVFFKTLPWNENCMNDGNLIL